MEVDREDVLKVARDLRFSPTEEEIKEVIGGLEDEMDNDPSGYLELWIENLLYSLDVTQLRLD